MADIDLKAVYDQKKQQFGALGAGNVRFDVDFLMAVNRSIGMINQYADLETRLDPVTSNDTTLDGLDVHYQWVLEELIDHGLMSMGRRPPKEQQWQVKTHAELLEMIDTIRFDTLNAEIEDDEDDEEDFVALGGLGD